MCCAGGLHCSLLGSARVELADLKERLQSVTQKAEQDTSESSAASLRISDLERERDVTSIAISLRMPTQSVYAGAHNTEA